MMLLLRGCTPVGWTTASVIDTVRNSYEKRKKLLNYLADSYTELVMDRIKYSTEQYSRNCESICVHSANTRKRQQTRSMYTCVLLRECSLRAF